MSDSKASLLLKATLRAQKVGNKVAVVERRLAKLVKEKERAEAEYMGLIAESFAVQPPGSSQSVTGKEGQPANPA
jgi:hypothetical protein